MRHRYLLLIMLIAGPVFKALAQPAFTLHGVINLRLSSGRLAGVVVTDLRSRDFVSSDASGWFTIQCVVGDTLLFTKAEFTDQKIVIKTTGDLPVYMQPVVNLDVVKIQGQTKKQELQEYNKDYARKGVYYDGKPPLGSILLNPLNDLHTLFGKDAKDLRRFKADSKSELEYAEVQRRYNLRVVMRVTGATDTVAKSFMKYYRPSYEDIKTWNDYELIRQIKKSYAFYDKSEDKDRLHSINAPTFMNAVRDSIK